MADEQVVDPSTVHRIWQGRSLHPHRQDTSELSTDPDWFPKLFGFSSVYMIRLRKQSCFAWMTHDYLHYGTTTLVADLKMTSGKISDACFLRHPPGVLAPPAPELSGVRAVDGQLWQALDCPGNAFAQVASTLEPPVRA